MENESKIVELLSEMLHKFDVLTGRVDNLTGHVDHLTGRVDNLHLTVDHRLGKVEGEIRALLKLGDNNDRLTRLENAVFE
jgi:hypothetical protein